MSKTTIIPSFIQHSPPTYHLKSEHSELDFSQFNERRDYNLEEGKHSENFCQIYITTSYTISIKNSEHFCRFDIVTPFESNNRIKDFSKEDFITALNYHAKHVKDYVQGMSLSFPNGHQMVLDYNDLNVDEISNLFLSYSRMS